MAQARRARLARHHHEQGTGRQAEVRQPQLPRRPEGPPHPRLLGPVLRPGLRHLRPGPLDADHRQGAGQVRHRPGGLHRLHPVRHRRGVRLLLEQALGPHRQPGLARQRQHGDCRRRPARRRLPAAGQRRPRHGLPDPRGDGHLLGDRPVPGHAVRGADRRRSSGRPRHGQLTRQLGRLRRPVHRRHPQGRHRQQPERPDASWRPASRSPPSPPTSTPATGRKVSPLPGQPPPPQTAIRNHS